MNEIDQLKIQARKLLEEVNHQFERTTGKHHTGSVYDFESACEYSFKNRLHQLRQKIASLQISSSPPLYYSTLLSN